MFQESVESGGAEHVHLIYDIDLVFACLGRKTHLLYQRAYIIYRVVGGGIQLMNVERAALVERFTGMALITGLAIGL